MTSASEHPQVVEKYLHEELAASRMVQVRDDNAPAIHCSPFGVIPKRNKPNKWRLILDLSAPLGHSVNDGIAKELASLSYVSVDDVVAGILERGRGTMMAKMDIQRAYRNIPVHPADRVLLGMQWQGHTFVDANLPFGLRSAPLIFSAIGDALQWVMESKGVSWVAHYIDDFVTLGMPGSTECASNVEQMHSACELMGLPREPEKDKGPATTLSFLGIEIDSIAMELRLPGDKLTRLREDLAAWRSQKACKKRELLSLIGVLSHASRVVRAGRSFLRRLIDLSMVPRHLEHYVRLNAGARSDIEWWSRYASAWNGISMMHLPNLSTPTAVVTSDASGSWGCGAYSEMRWFMFPWSGPVADHHITVKEMIPVVLVGALWGSRWHGRTVLVQCDNTAVVSIVNHGSSKNDQAMHLARCLAFITAKYDFHIVATHIRGVHNIRADALSRDNLPVSIPVPSGQRGRRVNPPVTTRPPNGVQARLDLPALDRAVEFYFQHGLAPSTQKSYNSAKKRYLLFCKVTSLHPLPATESLLCQFVSSLAAQSLRHTSIKSYLAAIRHLHIAEGYGDPQICNMARLEQVLKGIKSVQSKQISGRRVRLPITPDLLAKLRGVWSSRSNKFDGPMLWAAASLCFFGFMRSGEFAIPSATSFDEGAHLSFNDVAPDSLSNPTALQVRLKASKTDPFRLGVDIYVGKTGNSLCPVSSVLRYMVARGPGSGPFFRFENGTPLTRLKFVQKVKEALTLAGLDCSGYSGHSFRSGAATTAAKQGISDATIKMLGRWKSSAYQVYIQTPRDQLAAYSRRLGEARSHQAKVPACPQSPSLTFVACGFMRDVVLFDPTLLGHLHCCCQVYSLFSRCFLFF